MSNAVLSNNDNILSETLNFMIDGNFKTTMKTPFDILMEFAGGTSDIESREFTVDLGNSYKLVTAFVLTPGQNKLYSQ